MSDFKEQCQDLRAKALSLTAEVKSLRSSIVVPPLTEGQAEEMYGNLSLAYRHLEDARMRLGKSIQAYDGGASVYPK